jgi:surface polysaccharide O-acyltransferase-like enzyme
MATKRLLYIDWLRVLAVLLLFPFHTGRVFNAGEAFYVKGAETSTLVSRVLGFIDTWHMPLLFLLAGASTYLALGKRTRAQYARERVRRLLVPFGFGVLVLIPPQTWFGARFNAGYTGSYVDYLASGDFLVPDIREGGDYYGGLGTGHLWFILFLFVISLIVLPLWGGRRAESSRTATLSRALGRPTSWLVAPLAILVAEALPALFGKNLFYYLVFFVLGYLAMCAEAFMEAAERWRWPALVTGIVVTVWWVATGEWRDGLADPSLALTGVVYLGMLARWLVIIGLLGLGRRLLNGPSPQLAYLAEGSYPVYILHQSVIVVLAFYVVGLEVPWAAQWALLLAGSVVVTFLCYEGVRRVGWLRYLFGMRPRPGSPRRVPAGATPVPG